jgi:hypothetical protein
VNSTKQNERALFALVIFVGLITAGYYYNLTFVQLGSEDFGTRLLRLSTMAVARNIAFLAMLLGISLLVTMAYTISDCRTSYLLRKNTCPTDQVQVSTSDQLNSAHLPDVKW